MSDLISRSALIEYLEKVTVTEGITFETGFKQILTDIKNQPTVEAQPVVHCKDCSHWGIGVAGETEHVKCCEYGKYMVGENGYCCYADMRGGKND